MISAITAIADLFDSAGAGDYLGEPLTIASHLLQTAALAEAAGAPPALVAAALLHDVGHLRAADPSIAEFSGRYLMKGQDNRHGARGAAWLSAWFPATVTEPVRLHVAAKRYLCAVDESYFALLSPASVYTLSVQGGPMSAAQAREFEALPYAVDAVVVRRWDDQAKDPSAAVPDLAHFIPVLRSLATQPPG